MTGEKNVSFAGKLLGRLAKDRSGLALTELAFAFPIFMGFGMIGTETAYMAITNMKVSQAALTLADNASRMGQSDSTSTLAPTITEADINNNFDGLRLQTGAIRMIDRGRVILSSLEVKTVGSGGSAVQQQFVRWRRCVGTNPTNYSTIYNDDADNNGQTDTTFVGMGGGNVKARATAGSAVMFVEVEYRYLPLFGDLIAKNQVMRSEAAYNIRDDRNLAAGVAPSAGVTASTCS